MTRRAVHRTVPFILPALLYSGCAFAAARLGTLYPLALPFGILLAWAGWERLNLVLAILLLTLPFSSEFQVSSSLGTDVPDEMIMLLMAGLSLCYVVFNPAVVTKKLLRHPLVILLWMSFTWSVLAALFSTVPLASVKFLLAKTWYIGAFVAGPLIVFREKKNIRISAVTLGLSMLAVVLITLFRHAQYGFTFAHVNDALKPFFRNHVNYSAMLVCVIPVFYAFYLLTGSKKRRLLVAVALLILVAALFLSYSRGAWLALFAGIASWWLIRKRLMVIAYSLVLMFVIAAACWLMSGDRYLQYAHNYRRTVFHKDFSEHLKATYEFRDMSTAERFYRWIAGVRMIPERPLTGFGPATFYDNYKPYAVPAFKTWVSNNPEHSTVHNYFLLVLVEQGFPGLLLFILLTAAMLIYAQRLYHRARDRVYRMAAITAGTMLMMILTVNFLSDLVETDKIGSLFFICFSLLLLVDTRIDREQG